HGFLFQLSSPASPSFSIDCALPKTVLLYLQHSKSLAHSSENTRGIPPESESPAKLNFFASPGGAKPRLLCAAQNGLQPRPARTQSSRDQSTPSFRELHGDRS